MIEIKTLPCGGCGEVATFTMSADQLIQWKLGYPVQDVFPGWPLEDRIQLISDTCPSCWEEMWAEEAPEWEAGEWEEGEQDWPSEDYYTDYDDPTYASDWYVDDDSEGIMF